MSLSDNYPDIRPLWMNDYANAGVIDPRCSFARSDSTPSNVHYWSDEDHLSSENLLLQSSNFDTSWSANNLSGRNSGQTDPAGGTDGFEIVEDTANSWHRIYQVITATGDITAVVYAKPNAGTRYLMLTLGGGGNYLFECATFDLAGGTPNILHGSSSSFTSVSATQTASGNGYYKCVLKATGTCTSLNISITNTTATPAGNPYGLQVYTGDNTSSIDVAFASLATTGSTDYNPTTTQIHREYAATLKPVSYSGQPRFEYEPTGDRSARGLLIEGQAQNLIPYSESLASWSLTRIGATNAAAIGPDGTLSAAHLIANGVGNSSHYIQQTITTVASTTYTFSAFVKPAGHTVMKLSHFQSASPYTGAGDAVFTLTGDGSVTTTTGTATISPVGNGWYRVTSTGSATSTATIARLLIYNDLASAYFYADDYSGILCTGVQYEANSFASSYIKSNSGSASTRTGDSLSVATADIGYTGGPVGIVAEGEGGRGSYPRLFSMGDSSSYLTFFRLGSDASASTDYRFWVYDSGVKQADQIGEASVTRVAVSVDTNSIKSCGDGGVVRSKTSAVIPVLNTLRIGDQPTSGKQWNGNIKRIALYSEALTDTNLQALTS